MKKILLILTCISLTLLSCDSDDDSSPTASSLVGSWVTEWDIYNPEEQIIGKMEVEYTFTSKGEITLRNVWPDLDTYIETVTTGTYKDFGDYLAIDYKKAVETCTEPDGSVNYIKGQEEHHRHKTFREELEELFGSEFFRDSYNRRDWLDEDG